MAHLSVCLDGKNGDTLVSTLLATRSRRERSFVAVSAHPGYYPRFDFER